MTEPVGDQVAMAAQLIKGSSMSSSQSTNAGPIRTPARTLVSLLLATLVGVAWIAVASPASAHSELIDTIPAAGEQLRTPPAAVVLTFGEDVVKQGSAIVVTGPDGDRYDLASTLLVGGTNATIRLKPADTEGQFTVAYRIVSADGHVAEDSYTYRLNLPKKSARPSPSTTSGDRPEPPTGTTASTEGSGSGLWVLGLGAIGLSLIAAMIAVFVRRRRD